MFKLQEPMFLSFSLLPLLLLLSPHWTASKSSDQHMDCVDLPFHSFVTHKQRTNEPLNDFDTEIANYKLYTCSDYEGFLFGTSDATVQSACEYYGNDFGYGTNELAKNSCCICGGGTNISSAEEDITCYDQPEWKNYLGHDCDWFASDYWAFFYRSSYLSQSGKEIQGCIDMAFNETYDIDDNLITIIDVVQNFGVEECCVCGGGYKVPRKESPNYSNATDQLDLSDYYASVDEECSDITAWSDWFTGYGCPWYFYPLDLHFPDISWTTINQEKNVTCEKFYYVGLDNGYTAGTACCTCGGGVNLTRVVHEEYKRENTTEYYCLSTPGFTDASGNISCPIFSNFDTNPFADFPCDRFGDVIGKYQLTVNAACCECGGGYTGVLLGRQFRVSYTEDWSDSLFTLFPLEDDESDRNSHAWKKDGSIPKILQLAANATGFGMYDADVDQFSIDTYPDSKYRQCLSDVVTGLMDFCIGHIWNVTLGNALVTNSLFEDRFYLVVPIERVTWVDSFLTPFLPFSRFAWLCIIGIALYVALVLNIVYTGSSSDKEKRASMRIGNIFYRTANSFSSGGVSDVPQNPSCAEKVIIAGFSVSMLIILTAYTATSAAALVVGDSTKFKSLADVVKYPSAKLCINDIIYDPFLEKYPETLSVLERKNNRTVEILSLIECDGDDCCDAAIVHEDAYNVAIDFDLVYCENMKILLDEVLLKVDNVIYISATLGDYAKDFVRQVNILIDAGTYSEIHQAFKVDFKNGNKPPSPSPDLKWHHEKCPSASQEPNGEELTLGAFQLLFPLCFSTFATTLGLLCYFKKKMVGVVVQAKVGNEFSENEEDLALHRTIQAMSASNIAKELKSSGVDRDQLSAAVDSLPDKAPLVDLMFQSCCSVFSTDRDLVFDALTISELCDLMEYCHSSLGLTTVCLTDAMLDDDNVKVKLVRSLIAHPRSRRLAVTCARHKLEFGADMFSVLAFLSLGISDEDTSGRSKLLQQTDEECEPLTLSGINRKNTKERIQKNLVESMI